LIGHLANEVPVLVGRMIDSGLPLALSKFLKELPLNNVNSKIV
jgi:hypothetical protein